MDELLKQKLAENNVDLDGALARFMGNETLFLKFLKKFGNDMSYTNLMLNLDQENFEEAFKCAHTLKGVSANLGLSSISVPTSELTEQLRGKAASEINRERVSEERQKLKEAYERLIVVIEKDT